MKNLNIFVLLCQLKYGLGFQLNPIMNLNTRRNFIEKIGLTTMGLIDPLII
jgi:hypothetical protein